MSATDFLSSSSYFAAVVRALKKLGRYDEVLKQVSVARRLLENPHAESWWDGAASIDVTVAMHRVGGIALLREVGREAVTESMSVIARPLLSVLTAVSGTTPGTVFNRFGQLALVAVKNVTFTWTAKGDREGTLVIAYPIEVPPVYEHYWLGAFDYVWALTRRAGRATATHQGGTITFHLSWD